jgi:5'-nucleotidase
MKKLEVLIDLDNTFVDMTSKFLQEYNEMTNDNLTVDDVFTYDFNAIVKQPDLVQEIVCKEGFFSDLKPFTDAIHYFKKIAKMKNVDTTILTQPSRRAAQAISEKRIWISENLPKFNLSNVIFSHKKHRVTGDVFFDDAPEHLEKWKQRHGGITCKIEWPYNKSVKTDYTFRKETAWQEFYDLIISLRKDMKKGA